MNQYYSSLLTAALFLTVGLVTPSMADVATNLVTKSSSSSEVEANLSASKVTLNAGGKEVLSIADKVAPSDLLEYQTLYKNNGKSTIKSLMATLPIPTGMTYVAGTAKPSSALASLDGKSFAAMPLKRMVKKSDGKMEEQLVPLLEYRALRWSLGELSANAKVAVSVRTKVNAVAADIAK